MVFQVIKNGTITHSKGGEIESGCSFKNSDWGGYSASLRRSRSHVKNCALILVLIYISLITKYMGIFSYIIFSWLFEFSLF